MERVVRNGTVRYLVRRRGLSALTLVLALPWAAAGALSRLPAFYLVAGAFLLAALVLLVPARAFAVDAAAGALLIVERSLGGRTRRWTVPLGELRGVRALSLREPDVESAELWIDLPEGRSVLAVRSGQLDLVHRLAASLAEDLGCPLNLRGLRP